MVCADCGVELVPSGFGITVHPVSGGAPICYDCAALATELVAEEPYPPRTKVYSKYLFEYAAVEVTEERGPFARSVLINDEVLYRLHGQSAGTAEQLAIKLALEKLAPAWRKAPGPSEPIYASYCAWLASEGQKARKSPANDDYSVWYGGDFVHAPMNNQWGSTIQKPQPMCKALSPGLLKEAIAALKAEPLIPKSHQIAHYPVFNSLASLPVIMPDKYYLPPVVD